MEFVVHLLMWLVIIGGCLFFIGIALNVLLLVCALVFSSIAAVLDKTKK